MAADAKSTAGENPCKDAGSDDIAVTLRPKGPSPASERRLVLTSRQPRIPIGRASKDLSKGFIPAGDNAWLENPVMSRKHAELFADFGDAVPSQVYLQDMGSFHGTYLTTSEGKQQKVAPFQPTKLAHGDTIQFGINIFRSSKAYPPCMLEVMIEAAAAQKPDPLAHRSFTVPDDLDDEDEDCENEDDLTITAVYRKSSPVDLTRAWSPTIAPNRSIPKPIETTMNDGTKSNVIDLTSDVVSFQSGVEPTPVDQGMSHPRWSDLGLPRSALMEEARVRLSHTSDGRIIIPPPAPVLGPSGGECTFGYHNDSFDEDVESELGQYTDSDLDAPSQYTEESSDLGETDEPSRSPGETSSEVDDDIRSGLGDLDELSDDYLEEFAESDGFPDPYDEDSVGSFYPSDEEELEHDAATESFDDNPRSISPFIRAYQALNYETPLPQTREQSSQKQPATYDIRHGRDPSPSDAALFKRHPQSDILPKDSRAQQFGEKYEDLEVLADQEENRPTVIENKPVMLTTVTTNPTDTRELPLNVQSEENDNHVATAVSDASRSASPSLSCAPETVTMAEGTAKASEALDTTFIKLGDNNAHQYSAWTASGDQFINNPPRDTSPVFNPALESWQPELDMTSAYAFQQSKLATKPRRCPIEEILQPSTTSQRVAEAPPLGDSPTSHTSTPTKRSYEEAFNQTEVDTASKCADRIVAPCSSRIPESKNSDQTPSNTVDIPANPSKDGAAGTADLEEHEPPKHEPTAIVQPEVPRAAKRMRLATTAVQVVACVALGGAATFSYLVNTAPVL